MENKMESVTFSPHFATFGQDLKKIKQTCQQIQNRCDSINKIYKKYSSIEDLKSNKTDFEDFVFFAKSLRDMGINQFIDTISDDINHIV